MSLGHSGWEGIPKANSLWKEAVFVSRGTIGLITSHIRSLHRYYEVNKRPSAGG